MPEERHTRPRQGGEIDSEHLDELLAEHLRRNLTIAEIIKVREMLAEDDFVSKQEKKRAEIVAAKKERNNSIRAWIAVGVALCTLFVTTLGPKIVAWFFTSPASPK